MENDDELKEETQLPALTFPLVKPPPPPEPIIEGEFRELPLEPGVEEESAEEEPVEEEPEPAGPSFAEKAGRVAGDVAGRTLSYVSERMSPTKEANGDDLSDLFQGPRPDDPDIDTSDVLEVTEEDVFGDGGEDMSDILEVSEADVTGDDDADMSDDVLAPPNEEVAPRKRKVRRVSSRSRRRDRPSLGGMSY